MSEYKPGYQTLRKGRISLPHQIYLVTTTTHKREPVFQDWNSAQSACTCFESCAILKDSQMLSWVLMPDHAHWLIQLGESSELSLLVNRIKSASARLANRARAHRGSLWDRGFHDRALRREEDIVVAARYLVANPLRAGLVDRIGDYPYWNTVWLS